MYSGSEAGSYLRLIDCVYQLTLGLRVIKKKKALDPVTVCAFCLQGWGCSVVCLELGVAG